MCHRLAKFEHNRMSQTTQNFEFFDKKASITFDKASTPLWKFLKPKHNINKLLVENFHLSVFPKLL